MKRPFGWLSHGWIDHHDRRMARASQATLMSCGHRADSITHDTLAPYCSECNNVETMVEIPA